MKKIKILFYSHTIDYAGTWRSHERILLNLNKDLFDPYVFYNPNQNNNRLDYLKSKFDDSKIIPFFASKNKTGSNEGYSYLETDFSELAKKNEFDIIHFARSGYFEWPFNERISPIQIETNIFGFRDNTEFLDCSIAICDTIEKIRNGSDYVIYNPIPLPNLDDKNLKEEYGIKKDEFVFGRIGRKSNFHNISIKSLKKLKKEGIKFKYIIIGACEKIINTIKSSNLENECIILNETNDDYLIHKFHNTIDLFLHYRSDGECHSTAIAQSMMYGKPVISHFAGYNGQVETIKDGGFVCRDENEYCEKILSLCNDKNFYNQISLNSKRRALDFEEKKITSEWETLYKKLYYERSNNINLCP
jgi:glycosyltransferase involved in cell wall biosynthesis